MISDINRLTGYENIKWRNGKLLKKPGKDYYKRND